MPGEEITFQNCVKGKVRLAIWKTRNAVCYINILNVLLVGLPTPDLIIPRRCFADVVFHRYQLEKLFQQAIGLATKKHELAELASLTVSTDEGSDYGMRKYGVLGG